MSRSRIYSVFIRCAVLGLTVALVSGASVAWAQDAYATSGNASGSGDATGSGDAGASTDAGTPSDATSPSDAGTSEPDTGYEEPISPGGVEGLERVHSLPEGAFGENPPGIPYSSVLTKTGEDFNDIPDISGSPLNTGYYDPAKFGSPEGGFTISTGNVGLLNPIRGGTEPEDADLKAGPFFVKFHSIEGLVLYDDNYKLSESDRQSELLVLLRLNLSIIAQLTDNIQFSLSGSIDYLPIQNQVGVETSAYDGLGLIGALGPAFAAQFVYDTMIAGWPVEFADDFRVGTGTYSDSLRDDFNLFQGDTLEQQRDGVYTFHSGQANPAESYTSNNSGLNDSILYFSNDISALTEHDLPDDIRLTVRVSHENLWYNQDNRGLPPSRDDVFASLVSERENLRFKPYATYEATYIEGNPGVTQQVNVGFFGPIDDQLFLRASAGYYFDANNHMGALYEATLSHDAGPYTTEYFSASRYLSDFDEDEVTAEYYRLQQTLGPTLYGTLFVVNTTTRDLINDGLSTRTDDLGGVELTWDLGPKTTLRLAGIYGRQEYADGDRAETTTGRMILDRRMTDSLTFQLLYQYQHTTADRPGGSYYENIVYFRIIKLLD